jgi:hypothetical protein
LTSKSTAPGQSGEPSRTPDGWPAFTIKLRPKSGADGHAASRSLLKVALRQHGLVCLAIREGGA